MLNIIVLPDIWSLHRQTVRRSPALIISGRLEHHDGVTNIIAHKFEPIGQIGARNKHREMRMV